MMQKAERLELAKLVRMRAKVAKDVAEQRASDLRANFEEQLARTYPDDDAAWASITREVREHIKSADAAVAERCRELGIPERFRPSVRWYWSDRGENAIKERRTELRKVAETRIATCVKRAKVEIDKRAVGLQTELAKDGLESEQAKKFLDEMPNIQELMPPLAFAELEDAAEEQQRLT